MSGPAPSRAVSRRATAALLAVTFVWGWTFIWMKDALQAAEACLGERGVAAGVGLFMTLRFGLAVALLPLVAPAARRGLEGRAWRGGLVLGALLLGGFLLQMFGLRGVSPPVSAFLTSLYVLFTALFYGLRERRAPAAALLLGALLATFGAGFISGPPQLAFDWPEWLTVGCAGVFAAHILATDGITRRLAPLPVTMACFIWVTLGSAATLCAAMVREGAPPAGALLDLARTPGFLAPVLLSSVLATVLALTLMNLYQREIAPVRAAILYAVEPVWTAAFSVALGVAAPDRWLLAGGAALLAGNLVAELGPLRCTRRSAGLRGTAEAAE